MGQAFGAPVASIEHGHASPDVRARPGPDALPGLPMVSAPAEPTGPAPPRRPPPEPTDVERGVLLFDLDGTLLDDLGRISEVAADVMHATFGTPPDEARIHYLATTGMPFEAQLAQLYPDRLPTVRAAAARTFHQRKVTEAYASAKPFPEVPKLLKRLAGARWTLAITTGAETEMADLILEREGLRYWFEDVLGSKEGTKREHLAEYRRRYPRARLFLIGDSRFDMEAAVSVEGVVAIGRGTSLPGWTLTPSDLREWGAAWADYSLAELPETLDRLARTKGRPSRAGGRPAGRRRR